MQNKPNVKYTKISLNTLITMRYENMDNWLFRQTKPKQTQFKPKTNPVLSAVEWANLETAPGGSPGIICLIWAS